MKKADKEDFRTIISDNHTMGVDYTTKKVWELHRIEIAQLEEEIAQLRNIVLYTGKAMSNIINNNLKNENNNTEL